MKLNLWQWLGVALLVVGAVLLAIKYSRNDPGTAGQPASAPATSQPADQRTK
jgi:drug/metabolite transporter (DMT)-like permease